MSRWPEWTAAQRATLRTQWPPRTVGARDALCLAIGRPWRAVYQYAIRVGLCRTRRLYDPTRVWRGHPHAGPWTPAHTDQLHQAWPPRSQHDRDALCHAVGRSWRAVRDYARSQGLTLPPSLAPSKK